MRALSAALDGPRLQRLLAADSFVSDVIVLDVVDSTNDEIRRRAAAGAAAGLVVAADRQTAGRGRRGRPWHSPPRLGLYVSVLFRPRGPAPESTRWTLGAAVAACEACRETGAVAVEIEWPNDLVVGDRKLAGILVERRSAAGGAAELVVGAGFNVLQREADFPPDLAARATSLRGAAACGMVVERESLAAAFVSRLGRVGTALESGEWGPLARRWERLAPAARGRRVRVERDSDAGCVEGCTDGLEADGALRVRLDDGSTMPVRLAGSVRSCAREG